MCFSRCGHAIAFSGQHSNVRKLGWNASEWQKSPSTFLGNSRWILALNKTKNNLCKFCEKFFKIRLIQCSINQRRCFASLLNVMKAHNAVHANRFWALSFQSSAPIGRLHLLLTHSWISELKWKFIQIGSVAAVLTFDIQNNACIFFECNEMYPMFVTSN